MTRFVVDAGAVLAEGIVATASIDALQ